MLRFLLSKRERLRRAASDWLARMQNEPSDADRVAFERWFRASVDHADAFMHVRESFASAGLLTASMAAYRLPSRPEKQAASAWRPAALATAAMVSVAAVAGIVLLTSAPHQAGAIQQQFLVSTDVGELRTISLADGTRLTLDATTTVQVTLRTDVREVELRRGRIRAQVAHDQRPFFINAGLSRVTMPAGMLDIALGPQGTAVQILPGARVGDIGLARNGGEFGPLDLAQGQILLIPPGSGQITTAPSSQNDLNWPTGRLEFGGVALDAVVQEANRYSILPIRLEGEATGRLRVSGVFRAGDPAGLARSLAAAFQLDLEQREDSIILRSTARTPQPQSR